MGRSVSVPSGAEATAYLNYEAGEDADEMDWADFRDCIAGVLSEKYPSLVGCKYWLDREERVFLENRHAQVAISEYCGCVSVSLVPKRNDDHYPEYRIALAWCQQVAKGFEAIIAKKFPDSAMQSIGRASNGEQFFRPVSRPEGVVTSKEGTLW